MKSMKWLMCLIASLVFTISIGAQVYIGPVITFPNYPFTQVGTTPVLLKGSTYDGWTADALAAPAMTNLVSNGTFAGKYVMTVSFWSIANSQWASGFFTSPDLSSWTYVSGSLQTPSGGDYIKGNSGIVYSGSVFIWAYTHYNISDPNHHITIATSTDLINWTVVNSSPTGALADGDPSLNYNPNGTLELWTDDNDTNPGKCKLYTSVDSGTTWTPQSLFYTFPGNIGGFNTGEPSVYYIGNERYLVYDLGVSSLGGRYTQITSSPYQSNGWDWEQTANSSNAGLPWQSNQVFDAAVIVADTGDGRGLIPRMLYAGSDGNSPQDNTNSSIGLAYLVM
jgi:hypothetical protein